MKELHILALTLQEMEQQMLAAGFSRYRAEQIYLSIYKKHKRNFSELLGVSKEVKDYLAVNVNFSLPKIVKTLVSAEKDTIKWLLEFPDGERIETVLMAYLDKGKSANRFTVCVSSQIGCAIGCPFCATGKMGFKRSLLAEEIVGQVLVANTYITENFHFGTVGNIVFMGMGEPFLNYDNLRQAIKILNEPKGLQIGMRKITVSTSGIVPGIKAFANDFPQATLAISLHTPFEEQRNEMVPVNKKYNLQELMQAVNQYINETNNRVTFEYALIAGMNDSNKHAETLAKLLQGVLCHVNLIPLNGIKAGKLQRPKAIVIKEFSQVLLRAGIVTTLREEKGQDISAACGQLISETEEGE